ncbi:hypothetical protein CRG98_027788 [Punica granatum]|uniref:Uncharacterized protein n=1 Tax=Punica granatum TaxID=22663 RepID=A0A2I0J6E9_PUNGR|nr:hypothetical protein CRG98_027788 [Punica granatum]
MTKSKFLCQHSEMVEGHRFRFHGLQAFESSTKSSIHLPLRASINGPPASSPDKLTCPSFHSPSPGDRVAGTFSDLGYFELRPGVGQVESYDSRFESQFTILRPSIESRSLESLGLGACRWPPTPGIRWLAPPEFAGDLTSGWGSRTGLQAPASTQPEIGPSLIGDHHFRLIRCLGDPLAVSVPPLHLYLRRNQPTQAPPLSHLLSSPSSTFQPFTPPPLQLLAIYTCPPPLHHPLLSSTKSSLDPSLIKHTTTKLHPLIGLSLTEPKPTELFFFSGPPT